MIEQEVEAITADASFARSPVMVKLLRYLAGQQLCGDSTHIKSYMIAADGLGYTDHMDSQADTHARVAVARLRRMLEGYYSTTGKDRPIRLTIPKGSYKIHLIEASVQEAPSNPETNPEPSQRWWRDRRKIMAIVWFILLVVALTAGRLTVDHDMTELRWNYGDGVEGAPLRL